MDRSSTSDISLVKTADNADSASGGDRDISAINKAHTQDRGLSGGLSPYPGTTTYDEELRAAALRAANRKPPRAGVTWLFEWLRVFPVAVVLFLVLRSVLVEAYKIPSGSMESTLLVGDFLLVNKLVYGATIPLTNVRLPAVREPRRGDVVVFELPSDRSKNYVKRLVALSGDTVSMEEGVLLLNGVHQDERYAVHKDPGLDPVYDAFRWQRSYLARPAHAAATQSAISYRPSRNNWGPLVVPDGHYFMLGDNRDSSDDSRYWGFVPDSLVRGTPMLVYYSYSPDSMMSAPWLTNIRWRRLGERIR